MPFSVAELAALAACLSLRCKALEVVEFETGIGEGETDSEPSRGLLLEELEFSLDCIWNCCCCNNSWLGEGLLSKLARWLGAGFPLLF